MSDSKSDIIIRHSLYLNDRYAIAINDHELLTCHPDIEHPKRHISQGLSISTCKHLMLCHLRYQIMFTCNLQAEHSCTCMYQCPNILLTSWYRFTKALTQIVKLRNYFLL